MTDPNRLFASNRLCGLVIVGLLVSMSGCTQLTGRTRLAGIYDPAAEVPRDDQYQAPAASQIAAPEASAISLDGAPAKPQGQIQRVSHNQRHVAHQLFLGGSD